MMHGCFPLASSCRLGAGCIPVGRTPAAISSLGLAAVLGAELAPQGSLCALSALGQTEPHCWGSFLSRSPL